MWGGKFQVSITLFLSTIESPPLTKISAIFQRRQVSTNDSFEARIEPLEPVRRRRDECSRVEGKNADCSGTGRGQICESSSFNGEFLPRGGRSRGTRVHPISVPRSMLAPRDRDRAKTTGDRRGKIESAFCGPEIATGAFHGSI